MVFVHGDFGDGFDSWGPACEHDRETPSHSRHRSARVWGGFAGRTPASRSLARLAHCLTSWPPWASRRFISSGTPMAP